ncbi:PepSY domain-containing protein, partial [Klebsiella pneumoniae]|uniref:PepSY domain-containing protein n=1 Tax=Klebsiella pneumoniae TaxID=573 RepID=UPI00195341BC
LLRRPRPHLDTELATRLLIMRKPLTLLHRWGGLLAGLVLALLGLSGSLMVWQASLDSALNPAWFRAPTPACPATSQPVAAT